jgi:hypothetical protein
MPKLGNHGHTGCPYLSIYVHIWTYLSIYVSIWTYLCTWVHICPCGSMFVHIGSTFPYLEMCMQLFLSFLDCLNTSCPSTIGVDDVWGRTCRLYLCPVRSVWEAGPIWTKSWVRLSTRPVLTWDDHGSWLMEATIVGQSCQHGLLCNVRKMWVACLSAPSLLCTKDMENPPSSRIHCHPGTCWCW